MSSRGKTAASATPVLLQCFKKRYKLDELCIAFPLNFPLTAIRGILFARKMHRKLQGLALRMSRQASERNLEPMHSFHLYWLCSFPRAYRNPAKTIYPAPRFEWLHWSQ